MHGWCGHRPAPQKQQRPVGLTGRQRRVQCPETHRSKKVSGKRVRTADATARNLAHPNRPLQPNYAKPAPGDGAVQSARRQMYMYM